MYKHTKVQRILGLKSADKLTNKIYGWYLRFYNMRIRCLIGRHIPQLYRKSLICTHCGKHLINLAELRYLKGGE